MQKCDNNPVSLTNAAPRCTSMSKRTGRRCGAPAVRGWSVCYHHGAGGGAPEGKRNGAFRHSARSYQAITPLKLTGMMQRVQRDG